MMTATPAAEAIKAAKSALLHVTDISFEEDLVKYDDTGHMCKNAQHAIHQYRAMIEHCEAALKKVQNVSH